MHPANVRVTRQAAARQRALQQQLLQQQPDADFMAIDPGANLDLLDTRDPQQCHHYIRDIFTYLRELELEHRVSPHFMQVHSFTRFGPISSCIGSYFCQLSLRVSEI